MDPFDQPSALISKNGSVCSDQPMAAKVGLDILQKGGNAADAAIATFATLSILEPYMCGIGGDIQCLFYDSSTKSVRQINGSGRTGKKTSLNDLKKAGLQGHSRGAYNQQGLWVSIPGAAAALHHILNKFGSGRLSMEELLKPPIQLLENGVVLQRKASLLWSAASEIFLPSKNANDLLINGNRPVEGDIFISRKLANIYKNISSAGAETFYKGPTAQNIVEEVKIAGGHLTVEDFEEFWKNPPCKNTSEALCIHFKNFKVWEMRPNTIGIVALVCLKILEKFDLKSLGHNSAEYIHVIAEATKLSFLESWDYLCDPDYNDRKLDNLLSDTTAEKLKERIKSKATAAKVLFEGGNTSYIAVVDKEGNGCSFIASVSGGFGSGLIPNDCGFVLNNRLKCMDTDENSPNVYGPNKLSLHTIIPAMVTEPETEDLVAVFGVMGRWMQPQGHVQVLLNMIIFGMDPQTAVNQPRFFVGKSDTHTEYRDTFSELCLEDGIPPAVMATLETKGHQCKIVKGFERYIFGRGHVISRPSLFSKKSKNDCWWSGVDTRTDGHPTGY